MAGTIFIAWQGEAILMFPVPKNPNKWQTAYTKEDAFRDSGKRSLASLLAILIGSLIISGYISVRALPVLDNYINNNTTRAFFSTLLIVILVITLLFLLVSLMLEMVKAGATSFARRFLFEFYLPPFDVSPSKIIRNRLDSKVQLPPPLHMLSKFKSISFKDGQMDKGEEWAKWSALHLGGPLSLSVFDGNALYLERGNRFSRVVGSGNKTPFLEWFETIKFVVDLRPKVKEQSFDVWTKDGIRIRLTAHVICRVGDPANNTEPGLVFPFDPLAVQKAVECCGLIWPDPQKEPVEFNWIDAAWAEVTGIVQGYIGSRMLDDLLIADRKSGQILSREVMTGLVNQLNRATNTFGVYVMDFQIQQIEVPPKVTEQQKENWKAERQGMATKIDGQAKAFNIRSREKARAEAQKDLILAIAEGLEKNKSGNFSESLLLSLSGVLDESLRDPLTRATIAGETLDTLEKVQKLLNPSKDSGKTDASQRPGSNS